MLYCGCISICEIFNKVNVAMHSDAVHFERERGVTEVTAARGIAHVTIRLDPDNVAAGRLALLQQLAAANIPVFLVKLLPVGISFALREAQVDAGAALLRTSGVDYAMTRDLGLVTTIAGAMRDLSGIMAAIYEALVMEGIRVWQTGDAHNAVHCLVDGELAEKATETLQAKFALTPTAPETGQPDGVGLKTL
jgi:aspartate kinase